MSKLEQLINELCPNGVEFKKIKNSYTRIKGTPITAGKMKEIASDDGEIKIFAGGKTVITAHEADIPNANITRVPAVLVQSRGVIDAVYYDKPFTFKNEMWAYTADNPIKVKYLYYVLKNNIEHFREAASGMGSLPQISLRVTEDFIIPLPPLPVQEEIVRILDKFMELTTELTTELTARKQQYEYYRDTVLNSIKQSKLYPIKEVCDTITNFAAAGSFAEVSEKVPYLSKPDYAQLIRTVDIKCNYTNNSPIYISKDSYDYLWRVQLDTPCIVLPSVGNCGEVYYIDPIKLPYKYNALAKNALLIRSSKVNLLYLKYTFESFEFQKKLKKVTSNMGQSKFNKTDFEKLTIPIPYPEDEKKSLAEQQRIVDILDRFDKLCNDISEGLPAEIEARQKQYEYYRDRLLTFKKKEAAENE